MTSRAKCVTCGRKFAGDRDEAFRWLRYHVIVHELQAAVRERVVELEVETSEFASAGEPVESRAA